MQYQYQPRSTSLSLLCDAHCDRSMRSPEDAGAAGHPGFVVYGICVARVDVVPNLVIPVIEVPARPDVGARSGNTAKDFSRLNVAKADTAVSFGDRVLV